MKNLLKKFLVSGTVIVTMASSFGLTAVAQTTYPGQDPETNLSVAPIFSGVTVEGIGDILTGVLGNLLVSTLKYDELVAFVAKTFGVDPSMFPEVLDPSTFPKGIAIADIFVNIQKLYLKELCLPVADTGMGTLSQNCSSLASNKNKVLSIDDKGALAWLSNGASGLWTKINTNDTYNTDLGTVFVGTQGHIAGAPGGQTGGTSDFKLEVNGKSLLNGFTKIVGGLNASGSSSFGSDVGINGNVGIYNTLWPAGYKFYVQGNTKLDGATENTGNLTIGGITTTNNLVNINKTGSVLKVNNREVIGYNSTNNYFGFGVGAAYNYFADPVRIGGTGSGAPSDKLVVNGYIAPYGNQGAAGYKSTNGTPGLTGVSLVPLGNDNYSLLFFEDGLFVNSAYARITILPPYSDDDDFGFVVIGDDDDDDDDLVLIPNTNGYSGFIGQQEFNELIVEGTVTLDPISILKPELLDDGRWGGQSFDGGDMGFQF